MIIKATNHQTKNIYYKHKKKIVRELARQGIKQ